MAGQSEISMDAQILFLNLMRLFVVSASNRSCWNLLIKAELKTKIGAVFSAFVVHLSFHQTDVMHFRSHISLSHDQDSHQGLLKSSCECISDCVCVHVWFKHGRVAERTGAKMALVDSAAAFASHCDLIDQTGALKKLCVDNGLRTFSQLAFGVGAPQQPCSDDEFKVSSDVLNGGVDLSVAELSRFRRLHFESKTLVVAHLKSQITSDPASDAPKKLAQAEKVARLDEQQKRLSGLEIKGELQPSFVLIDLV